MSETSEAAAFVGIVEDIAALARRLAEKEPYKSATGPEALLALAVHLDGMVAGDRVILTGWSPVTGPGSCQRAQTGPASFVLPSDGVGHDRKSRGARVICGDPG